MKRIAPVPAIVAALALALSACGSGGETVDTGAQAEPTTIDDQAAADDADNAMTDDSMEDEAMEGDSEEAMMDEGHSVAPTVIGLEITSVDFDTSEVVIVNNSDSEVTLDGYFMCNFPDYAEIVDVGTVAPGASVTVTSPVGLSSAAGELGLYSTDSFSSPEAIQAYVEWGSPDHERSSVAIDAGIYDGSPFTVEGNMLTVG